ncbi:LCP family protein [Streptomyces sp. NPDC002643]
MNDRYDAGHGGDQQFDQQFNQQYELVGYDEYGQPVYREVPQQQAYDPYWAQQQSQSQLPQQQPQWQSQHQPQQQPQGYGYDPYNSYDPYGQATSTGQQQGAQVAEQTAYIPQQQVGGAERVQEGERVAEGERVQEGERLGGDTSGGLDSGERYRTEQFAFVDQPDGDSEDVIDWLNFTENRTERREEAKRRARSRLIALTVVLALVAVGGVGYMWFAGMLPGASSGEKSGTTTSAAAQKRDVIVVHLHDTKKDGTSTALLVDNTTTKQGATVLLPNSLALTGDDGTTTTLAKSVEDDGSSGTREELDTVLGTDIQGTWRLDTPYLNNLVELVGNIDIDTDVDVPDPEAKKGEAPLVKKGEKQTLSGKMAVAYATYRASGESQDAQLKRFGQVMQGVLRKMSSDADAATLTVQTLGQILDPSLSDKDLGAFFAKLAEHAKGGDYRTELLPVEQDGTVGAEASDGVVKELLGGTAKSPDAGDALRVGVRNGTGEKDSTEQARVTLLNGGYTFLDAGTTDTAQAASQVTYADAARKQDAVEVAKTLGLPTSAVKKGETTSNADVSVVLGQNYAPGAG